VDPLAYTMVLIVDLAPSDVGSNADFDKCSVLSGPESRFENVQGSFHERPGQEDIVIFNATLLKVGSLRIVGPTPQR